jgi:universal stress protein E
MRFSIILGIPYLIIPRLHMADPHVVAIARYQDIYGTEQARFFPNTPTATLTARNKFTLLLALSSDHLSGSAIRVANVLAHERGAIPSVVQVFGRTLDQPSASPLSLMVFADSLLGPDLAEEHREQLRDTLSKLCGHAVRWPVKLVFGSPSTCIINEAQKQSSQLIVLGLNTHCRTNRILGFETTIQTLEHLDSAMLAVTPELQDVPKKVLVGVDFSPASIRAAFFAAKLVAPYGVLTLAYVHSPQSPEIERDNPRTPFLNREEITTAFSSLAQDIAELSDVTVITRYLEGEPAPTLLAYAERSKSDLIALGSQRHTPWRKMSVGSVTKTILREGPYSVLVAPPTSTPSFHEAR